MVNSRDGSIAVFDGHIDSLTAAFAREKVGGQGFLQRGIRGHVDLPRARSGNLKGAFCAICVPPNNPEQNYPKSLLRKTANRYDYQITEPMPFEWADTYTRSMLTYAHRLSDESSGALTIIRSREQLADGLTDESFAMVLHLEGAEAVAEDLSNLQELFDAGIRSVGPLWSRPCPFGEGVPFSFPSSPDTGPGLTNAGRRLVREAGRLGILIDCSHMTERAFLDTAEESSYPLVVSHSASHRLCPTARNLTDNQLRLVAETGGVVGITFHVNDIRGDAEIDADCSLEPVVRHIAHLVELAGEDCVAFGSDFDGASIPKVLADVTRLQDLITELRKTGFDEPVLRKICHENWLRVLRATLPSDR